METSHAAHRYLQCADTLRLYSCHGYEARYWQGPGIVGNLEVLQKAVSCNNDYIYINISMSLI